MYKQGPACSQCPGNTRCSQQYPGDYMIFDTDILYFVCIRDFSAMNFHFDECCNRYPKFSKLVKVNIFLHNMHIMPISFPGV